MARFFYPYGNAAELSGKSYTVGGGTKGLEQPTFSGDPLFSGQYIRIGNFVHFEIEVDFSNILTFGTGQYYLTLPFAARSEVIIREGSLYDGSDAREFHMSGHTTPDSTELLLYSSDKIASGVQDVPFTFETPITLDNTDHFHISGSYITA